MPDIQNRIRYGEPNNWTENYYNKSLIVLHETVTHETEHGAEQVAGWFNDPSFNASTQYIIDNRDIIQCVPDKAYAWSAGTTANIRGIHIELVSMANQTPQGGWADRYSSNQLELADWLVRKLADEHNIPLVRLGTNDLRADKDGITGHYNVSYAWRESTHEDIHPDEFPWDRFMDMVHNQEVGVSKQDVIDALNDPQVQRMLFLATVGAQKVNVPRGAWSEKRRKENPVVSLVTAAEASWQDVIVGKVESREDQDTQSATREQVRDVMRAVQQLDLDIPKLAAELGPMLNKEDVTQAELESALESVFNKAFEGGTA